MPSEKKTSWSVLRALGGFLPFGCLLVVVVVIVIPAVYQKDRSAERTAKLNNLSQFAKTILLFRESHGTMPAKVQDLQPFGIDPLLLSGEIEVNWGAALKDQDGGMSNVLMAWYTTPSDGWRLVSFMDGSVAVITESDFQKRSKAPMPGNRD
jgi:hypothetical protein